MLCRVEICLPVSVACCFMLAMELCTVKKKLMAINFFIFPCVLVSRVITMVDFLVVTYVEFVKI